MMFFLFVWWNFSSRGVVKKIEESLNNPIFFVGTSPGCPYCVGLGDKVRKYCQQLGNNTKVVFTHTDCSKTFFCRDHNFYGVPVVALIRGTNDDYWQRIFDYKPESWTIFLRTNIGPIAQKVDNISEELIAQTEGGGTHFHLVTNQSDTATIKKYTHLSALYRLYYPKFSYQIDNVSTATITAYYSYVCKEIIKIGSLDQLENFIKSRLISHFHRYTLEEYIKASSKGPIFLLVMDDSRNPIGTMQLRYIHGQKCLNYSFGVVYADKDRWISDVTKMNKFQESYYTGINKENGCLTIASSTSNPSQIVKDTIEGHNCRKIGKPKLRRMSRAQVVKYAAIIAVIIAAAVFYWLYRQPEEYKLE